MKIGIVLTSLPNYSETFFNNKVKVLIDSGYSISIFVNNSRSNTEILPFEVPIFSQPDIEKKTSLLIKLILLIITSPKVIYKFIKLENLSRKKWSDIFKNLVLNTHILNKRLDWVHFGFATAAITKENVAEAIGARLAVSLRGFDINFYPYKHKNCYDILWSKVDKVHTISNALYSKAIALGLDPSKDYEKITPAVNTSFFKTKVFRSFSNPLRLLTVGRLEWVKGYDYLLYALHLLKNKGINFECHIVGEGSCYENIMFAINQLNLKNQVKLERALSHNNVYKEMEWADIYIQPSIEEGFCNSVLEAQAMGLLCIVTNSGGLTENIIDNKTGWVVPKRNSKFILDKIISIMEMDNSDLQLISKNAIERVNDKFNIEFQKNLFKFFYR